MRKDGDIMTYSAEALEAMRSRGESGTDWDRQRRLTDEEIERAAAADPDWQDVPRDWYKAAVPFYPREAKRQITLRVDPDLLDWFKAIGAKLPDADQRRAQSLRGGPDAGRAGVTAPLPRPGRAGAMSPTHD